jgi:UDP-N-acetylglucosamine 2-epimerase (non-hydrolysing)
MIDTLFAQLEKAQGSVILSSLSLSPRSFAVLTLHRPANVDDAATLRKIFVALEKISAELPVIFPAHPRTQSRMREFGLKPPPRLKIIEPLGYSDFLKLWSNARLVLTDSGGLQEETTALGIPCLTLAADQTRPARIPELWDGHAAERIVEALLAGC